MAKTATKSRSGKQATSRFYVVRSIQDVRKNVSERVETYQQDFIKDPLDRGKQVVKDLKADPRKTLDSLVEDSRKFVADVKKDTRKKVDGVVADSRKFYKRARKDPRKAFAGIVDDGKNYAEELLDDGKSFMQGVEKDARLVVDEMVDNGKKALDKVPGKKKLQRQVQLRIKSVPRQFNLPTRNDIDRLTDRLEELNTKIDAMDKSCAA